MTTNNKQTMRPGDTVAMLGEGGLVRRGQVGVLTAIGEAESKAEFLFWENSFSVEEAGVVRTIKVPTAMPLKLVGLDKEEVRAAWGRAIVANLLPEEHNK